MYPDEMDNRKNSFVDNELASAMENRGNSFDLDVSDLWSPMENWGDSFDWDISDLLSPMENCGDSVDLDISDLLSPYGLSPDVEGSSDAKHPFLDSFEQNANPPQVDSDKSIVPPLLSPTMSTSETQNYDGSSLYLSGCSDRVWISLNEPNQKRQGADNLGVGFYMPLQKYRRLPPSGRNSPPGETLTPDDLANTSQPLKNVIPCEDRCETSNERNCQEKETHFEKQPTETQSNNPVTQAIVETIGDNNIPNPITDHDVVDNPTHMGGQPCVRSISTQPSYSFSSIKNAKSHFDELIALRLEDLSDTENAASMIQVLTILKEDLSLFSSEQGDQILKLWLDFPIFVTTYRERHSQCQKYSQKSFAETVKIRDLVETSGKDEESLKARYEELENNEKELMKQLEAVEKEKAEIAEKRTEKSKHTKDLKEREAYLNKEEDLLRIATAKLQNLSDQWVERQSFFM